jgi:hypothetical protein
MHDATRSPDGYHEVNTPTGTRGPASRGRGGAPRGR